MKKDRNSNIELLRVIAMFGVIILHYNNPNMGGGLKFVSDGSVNFYVLYFLNSISICAVNIFMLISGYYLCESKKRNLWRPVELIVQVVLFNVAIYLAEVLFQVSPLSIKRLVGAVIPSNYFVILYCTVYIVSPYIGIMIEKLSVKSFDVLITTMMVLFSLYPTIVDVLGEIRGEQFIGLSSVGMYGSQWGYTVVNFLLMYLIGAYINKNEDSISKLNNWKLIGLLFACVAIIAAWARINDYTGYFAERSAWEYCNPLIILVSIIVFILFNKMKIGVIRIINALAEAVFSVYLLHGVFLPHLKIESYVSKSVFLMLIHIIVCLAIIYLICWCINKVYHLVTDPIFSILKKRYTGFIIDAEK